mmetsp:Transcript_41792/g.110426  ORF Transcript_41792/g.110426 Transcript_41792/m.110426 type:complete len:1093 (+) Transcript_41792:362-3640(+)
MRMRRLDVEVLLPDDDLVALPQVVVVEVSSQELAVVGRVLGQGLLQLGVLLGVHGLRPHVHRGIRVQLGVLAHPVHAVRDFSRHHHERKLRVRREVEDDGAAAVAHGPHVRVGPALHLARQGHLLGKDLVACDCHLAALLELRELLGAQLLHGGRHRLHVLAELLAEHLEVERRSELEAAGRGLEGALHDVQLLLDVRLERLQVLHDGRVLVDDHHGLQGHLLANLRLLAELAAQLDDTLHALHGHLDVRVEDAGVELRDHDPVDGLGLQRVPVRQRPGQVLVDHLRDEGRDGGQHHRGGQQDLVERAEGGLRLLHAVLAAHAVAVQPDVAVREALEQPGQLADDGVQAVGVHLLAHELDEVVRGREDPLVHEVLALLDPLGVRLELAALGLEARGLQNEELVGVVPGQEDILDNVLDAGLAELQRLGADHRRVAHVHADGVGAVRAAHERRVRVVLQALAHLLPVPGQDEAVHDEVLEGGLVEDDGGQHHQGVEPAAGLVQALGDELRGEALLEVLLVLEGVVLARVGHRAALEPAVEDLVDALEHPLALLRRDLDVVDEVAVEVRDLAASVLLELRHRADADNLLEVVRDPEGQRSAPVPVPGHAPVPGVHQPVVEALLLHKGRDPVRLVVALDDPVADLLDLDEPGRDGLVDQGRVRPPAQRIVVHLSAVEEKLALILELLLDALVGVLDELALEVRDGVHEAARVVDGVHHVGAVLQNDAGELADAIIVLSVGGRLVDDARARARGDVLVGDHAPALLLVDLAGALPVVEEGLVLDADQGVALHLLQDLEVLLPVLLDGGADPVPAVLADDPLLPVVLPLHEQVLERRVDAEGQVGGQGPGRRRPRQDVRVLPVGPLELHDDGGVGHLLVVLRGLEVRHRGAKGRAERDDAPRAVDHPLVEELLERPPDALHVAELHGLVVVVKVDPAAEARDDVPPLLGVLLHDAAALLVVLVDAHLHDVGASPDLELRVDDALDRDAVAVPAEAPLHVVAALVRVARDDVLDRAREDVAIVRQPGGERRAVVEVEGRLALRLAQGLLEGVDLCPVGQGTLLLRREVDGIGQRPERGLRWRHAPVGWEDLLPREEGL